VAELRPIWQSVLQRLKPQLDAEAFSTWLAGTVLLALDDQAVVGADNVFVRDELVGHYQTEIAAALAAEIGQPVDVEIVIQGRP
jgi:chromosomal replication initiator protein